jgi:hypothetical protein
LGVFAAIIRVLGIVARVKESAVVVVATATLVQRSPTPEPASRRWGKISSLRHCKPHAGQYLASENDGCDLHFSN